MNAKAIITLCVGFLFLTLMVVGAVFFIQTVVSPGGGIEKFLYGLLTTLVVTFSSYVLGPIRTPLANAISEITSAREACRMYMFGIKGAGKTTILNSFLSKDILGNIEPTEIFNYVSARVPLRLDKPHIEVGIADYKGEKPSMVILDAPESFIGRKGDRVIHALLVVVDIVPRLHSQTGGVVRDDREIMEWLSVDTKDKIRLRIKDNLAYVTPNTIELLFQLLGGRKLHSVRLLINKLDLLESAEKSGFFEDTNENAEAFVRKEYADLEKDLGEACRVNGIDDYSVQMLSATKDRGVREAFSSILRRHVGVTQ